MKVHADSLLRHILLMLVDAFIRHCDVDAHHSCKHELLMQRHVCCMQP